LIDLVKYISLIRALWGFVIDLIEIEWVSRYRDSI